MVERGGSSSPRSASAETPRASPETNATRMASAAVTSISSARAPMREARGVTSEGGTRRGRPRPPGRRPTTGDVVDVVGGRVGGGAPRARWGCARGAPDGRARGSRRARGRAGGGAKRRGEGGGHGARDVRGRAGAARPERGRNPPPAARRRHFRAAKRTGALDARYDPRVRQKNARGDAHDGGEPGRLCRRRSDARAHDPSSRPRRRRAPRRQRRGLARGSAIQRAARAGRRLARRADRGRGPRGGASPPPSAEQAAVVASVSERVNVACEAVAGSGKTTTVLHCAREVPHLRFLVLTYNARLKLQTRQRAKELGLSNLEVHSFHAMAARYYAPDCRNDETLRRLVDADAPPHSRAVFDCLIIDEAQDLTPSSTVSSSRSSAIAPAPSQTRATPTSSPTDADPPRPPCSSSATPARASTSSGTQILDFSPSPIAASTASRPTRPTPNRPRGAIEPSARPSAPRPTSPPSSTTPCWVSRAFARSPNLPSGSRGSSGDVPRGERVRRRVAGAGGRDRVPAGGRIRAGRHLRAHAELEGREAQLQDAVGAVGEHAGDASRRSGVRVAGGRGGTQRLAHPRKGVPDDVPRQQRSRASRGDRLRLQRELFRLLRPRSAPGGVPEPVVRRGDSRFGATLPRRRGRGGGKLPFLRVDPELHSRLGAPLPDWIRVRRCGKMRPPADVSPSPRRDSR